MKEGLLATRIESVAGTVRLATALVFAAIASAALTSVLSTVSLMVAAFNVALLHAFVLGLPTYLIVRSKRPVTWLACVAAGLVIGAVPLGLFMLPQRLDSAMSGNMATVVDGARTAAGWLEYLWAVAFLGAHGMAGGFAFWLALRLMGNGVAPPRPARTLTGLLLVGAASAGISAIPVWNRDRSCFNPLYDGGQQAGSPVIRPFVRMESAEWPAFVGILSEFGETRGWLIRSPAQGEVFIASLRMSICDPASRTLVTALRLGAPGGQAGVRIYVYQPQGDTSWQAPIRHLVAQLSSRWPGKVGFADGGGRESDLPSSVLP